MYGLGIGLQNQKTFLNAARLQAVDRMIVTRLRGGQGRAFCRAANQMAMRQGPGPASVEIGCDAISSFGWPGLEGNEAAVYQALSPSDRAILAVHVQRDFSSNGCPLANRNARGFEGLGCSGCGGGGMRGFGADDVAPPPAPPPSGTLWKVLGLAGLAAGGWMMSKKKKGAWMPAAAGAASLLYGFNVEKSTGELPPPPPPNLTAVDEMQLDPGPGAADEAAAAAATAAAKLAAAKLAAIKAAAAEKPVEAKYIEKLAPATPAKAVVNQFPVDYATANRPSIKGWGGY